jgi:hypothetical protein
MKTGCTAIRIAGVRMSKPALPPVRWNQYHNVLSLFGLRKWRVSGI